MMYFVIAHLFNFDQIQPRVRSEQVKFKQSEVELRFSKFKQLFFETKSKPRCWKLETLAHVTDILIEI